MAKDEPTRFTIEQMRTERLRVIKAAKQTGGAIVVDEHGARRFSIWIPQGPID